MVALEQASAAAKAAHVAIAKHRAHSRKRDESADMRETLTQARHAEIAAANHLREMRRRLKPLCDECRKALMASPCPHATLEAIALLNHSDVISDRAKDLAKNAYQYAGIFWGQRALVVDAAAQSFASLPMYDLHGNANDPRFVRWAREGSVGLQIMGGLSVEQVHAGDDARLRLRPPDPRAWSGWRRCTVAQITPDGRAPIRSDAKR